MSAQTHIKLFVTILVLIYKYICIYVYTYIRIYVYMYICICIYVYIYMYLCISTMISPFWFYIHHISIYGFLPWMLNKSTEAALPRDPRHGLHVQPAAGEGHENGTGCRRGPLRSWRLKSPRYCPGKRNFGNGNLNRTHRHRWKTDWITIGDLETTIRKLRFGNYGWETNNLCFSNCVSRIWKL